MSKAKVYEQARAKINLSLGVSPPNEDGMHPISSKMVTLLFCDELEVTRLEAHSLSRYAVLWHLDAPKATDIDWQITNDLAVQAHMAIERAVGHPLPVQMKLQKRIPVGGGLGGGSADAAAMLRATAKLFDVSVDLLKIATTLGSDVPFLLEGGAGEVSGIGEIIARSKCVPMHVVLVIPEYSCSTPDVFQAFDITGCEGAEGTNDLLASAWTIQPRLKEDMQTLFHIAGKEIHLSGSGSTMFVICDTTEQATEMAQEIQNQTAHVAFATQTSE
jgi:4-diphosphocytidyl-2-C-methyl-D-erythritol kinase